MNLLHGVAMIVEAGEACDDGNNLNQDGCSFNCQNEAPTVCGDGIQTNDEACDDGNNLNGDGCSAQCEIEAEELCGNGVQDPDEACDDGNNIDGDGCSANCAREGGQVILDDGQLGCVAISQCLVACPDGDQNCSNACIATGTLIGQIRFNELRQCIVENECVVGNEVNADCIEANCAQEEEACFGASVDPVGMASCTDLIECVERCDGLNCIRQWFDRQ